MLNATEHIGTITSAAHPYNRLKELLDFAMQAQTESKSGAVAEAQALLKEYEGQKDNLRGIDDTIDYLCEFIEDRLTLPYTYIEISNTIDIVPDVDAAIGDILDGYLTQHTKLPQSAYYQWEHSTLTLCYTYTGYDEQVIWSRKINITWE